MKGQLVEVVQLNKKGEVIRRGGPYPNLFVDDGKEYTLDFMFGIHTWHNYDQNKGYATGQAGLWTTKRYAYAGLCMFNNASQERANGINGIATGQECSYPMSTTLLVSPEDSFLSRPTGNSVEVTCTRRDQTVEIIANFTIPGDLPSGVSIREFGIFLGTPMATRDPSYNDANKPRTLLCRTALYGTGVCAGVPVYTDDPRVVVGTNMQFRWRFGEI